MFKDKMFLDKKSLDKMTDKMYVYQMFMDKMVLDKIPLDRMTCCQFFVGRVATQGVSNSIVHSQNNALRFECYL